MLFPDVPSDLNAVEYVGMLYCNAEEICTGSNTEQVSIPHLILPEN